MLIHLKQWTTVTDD